METYSLINITEQVVDRLLDDIIEEEHGCACAKCRLDAKALALNNLQPKYVVTEKGGAFESFRMSMMQNRVDVYQAVFEAVTRVKSRPQHDAAHT